MNYQGRAGRGGGRSGGRGAGRGGRGGRGGYHATLRNKYSSKNEDIKNDVFEEGKTENAAQFVETKKTIVEWIRRGSGKEVELVARALESETTPTITAPPRPPHVPIDPANPALGERPEDPGEFAIWNAEIGLIAKRRSNLRDGLSKAYAILWEQCSPSVQGRIKGMDDYPTLEASRDPVDLIKKIHQVCCGADAHRQPIYAMVQTVKALATFFQGNRQSNEDYKEKFDAHWSVVEQLGGNLVNHTEFIDERAAEIAQEAMARDATRTDANPTDAEMECARNEIAAEVKAAFMLSGASNSRYKELKDYLENQYVTGSDNYPRSVEGVLALMNNFRVSEPRRGGYRTGGEDDGLAFVQEGGDDNKEEKEGAIVTQSGKKEEKEVKTNSKGESACFHCGGKDHWIRECPELTEAQKGQILVQLGAVDGSSLVQKGDGEEETSQLAGSSSGLED